MSLPEALAGKNSEEFEEWFLAGIDEQKPPVDDMLAVLAHMVETGETEQAYGWAELFQDSLSDKSDSSAALDLLELRYTWHSSDSGFRLKAEKAAKAAFNSRLDKVLVKNAGFDADVSLEEVFRRLRLLLNLVSETLCFDNTWGFGIVQRVDDFYAKVTIDFSTKRDHEMSLAYAAETLDLITEDHLFARKHNDSAALEELVQKDPKKVVCIALRSFGPMNPDDLKERLVPEILPDSAWKKFWDQARKGLKADLSVEVPSKRNEPIRFVTSSEDNSEEWYSFFEKERDPATIVKLLSEIEAKDDLSELDDIKQSILINRLAFAIWGSEGTHPDITAMALLAVDRLGFWKDDAILGDRKIDLTKVAEHLIEEKMLPDVLSKLPVRTIDKFLVCMAKHLETSIDERLLALLPGFSYSVLNEVVNRFKSIDKESRLTDRYKELFNARESGVVMLLWLSKNSAKKEEWGFVDDSDLMMQGIESIEESCVGEKLRSQNQLRGLFESPQWIADRMSSFSQQQREIVLRRIMLCRGWDEVGRRSVIGGIVKAYPELKEILIDNSSKDENIQHRGRTTSWRSFRERQEQLRRIVEEDIPANSKEIGVARSYGDLRENAEYQAAKDHQKILHQRRSDIERDLASVRGYDFADFSTDEIDVGTVVTVLRPGGINQQICILGEWDRDEELDIISSESRLAKLLLGHKEDEEIMLPSEVGEELCKIIKIDGLSAEIKKWVEGGASHLCGDSD